MNIQTSLQFGDNVSGYYNRKYLVVGADTHFFRTDDGFNPNSSAQCGFVELTVIATNKKDLFLQEWFFNNSSHSGRLTFEMEDATSDSGNVVERSLTFSDAHCYSFSEKYDIGSDSLRLFDLKIKMGECSIDGVSFSNGSF